MFHFDVVGNEAAGAASGGGCAAAILDPWVQEMQDCKRCGGPQVFVAAWVCEAGLIGCCLGCSEERILPFTRARSEAA
jgi:hypothetical protein